MDQVKITRLQLRELAKQDEPIIVVANNTDTGMICVARDKYPDKTKWMLPNGKYQKEG